MPRLGRAACGRWLGRRHPRDHGHPRQRGGGHAPSAWANTGTFQPARGGGGAGAPARLGHTHARSPARSGHPRTQPRTPGEGGCLRQQRPYAHAPHRRITTRGRTDTQPRAPGRTHSPRRMLRTAASPCTWTATRAPLLLHRCGAAHPTPSLLPPHRVPTPPPPTRSSAPRRHLRTALAPAGPPHTRTPPAPTAAPLARGCPQLPPTQREPGGPRGRCVS